MTNSDIPKRMRFTGLRDIWGSGYEKDGAHARVAKMSDREAYERMSDVEVILEVLCAGQNRDYDKEDEVWHNLIKLLGKHVLVMSSE